MTCGRSVCWLIFCLATLGVAQHGRAEKFYFKSFLKRRPPELQTTAEQWVNQKGTLTLEKLRGKVVWLEFNF